MTPKQALNNIRYHYFNGNREYNDLDTEWSWFEITEQALKRLEHLEEEKQSFDIQIEKKLKALEIIKKCCLLSKHELVFTNKIEISQEEYYLLKEVL